MGMKRYETEKEEQKRKKDIEDAETKAQIARAQKAAAAAKTGFAKSVAAAYDEDL